MNSHNYHLFLVFGIGIIVFLRYTARTLTRYSGAKVQVARGAKFEATSEKSFEIHNPREIRFAPNKSYEIARLARLQRSLRKLLRGLLVIGGVFMIWILRGVMITPLVGLMSKGLLL